MSRLLPTVLIRRRMLSRCLLALNAFPRQTAAQTPIIQTVPSGSRQACASTNARFPNPLSEQSPAKGAPSIVHHTVAAEGAVRDGPPAPLTEREYHARADEMMDHLVDVMEELGEEVDVAGFDVVYASGVLNVTLGSLGTYVVNKQPPNKQIWLSSPVSGPKRFDYVPDTATWICLRTDEDLQTVLATEFSQLLGRTVRL
ncbi:hypothetical protein HDU88_008017 [Geranomyces variabilis]|nr:hypothetical protein HDU88_008017 [Geranomyces variabilis]